MGYKPSIGKLIIIVVGKIVTEINRGAMLETTIDNFMLQALLESTGDKLAFSNGYFFGAAIISWGCLK